MVRVKRAIALLLMTILILTNATIAYAGEADGSDILAESREGKEETLEKKKEEEPVAETNQVDDGTITTDEATTGDTSNTLVLEQENEELTVIGDNLDTPIIGEDQILDSKLLEKQPLKEAVEEQVAEPAFDVCFYIRGNGIGFDIPKEPANYYSTLYSDPIRVDDAIKRSNLSFSTSEDNGQEDSLLSDGFTASNGVTATISNLPSAEDIKGVVPDFDPEIHYVVWYVVKWASTGGSNSDVNIHVDGVIRLRQNVEQQEEIQPEPGVDPELVKRLDEIEAGISEIQIVPRYRDEYGREMSQIEYDGKPHMVGGFDIVVVSMDEEDEEQTLAEFLYNCLGKLLDSKVYAGENSTEFVYKGETFSVNITSAYTYVVDELQEDIQFYRGSEKVSLDDIEVTDPLGRALHSCVSIPIAIVTGPSSNPFDVKKRSIEITARSTVRNDNGTTITNDGYDITGGSLAEGHKIKSITILGSQTGVGQSTNEITSIEIVDENGNTVTDRYDINLVKGKLQLVDGSKKNSDSGGSFQYSRKSNSDESGLRYTPEVSGTAKKDTTEIINGRVARAKITHSDGSVTYINVPFETSYGNDLSDNQPQVLGARRASTGDDSDTIYRIMIILVSMIVLIQLIKKNNTSAEMS